MTYLRKLKKAFHHGSHEDLNDAGGGRGDDHLSSSAPASESPLSHRRHSSGKKGRHKFSVPQGRYSVLSWNSCLRCEFSHKLSMQSIH